MTDILAAIDSATEERCACGCGTRLDPEGPSAFYVDAGHQQDYMERQATNPRAVRGSTSVAWDEARWRPELLADEEPTDLRLLDAAPASYTGALFATVFERLALDAWHLRLHDGNRYVGVDVATSYLDAATSPDEVLAEAWSRLERELTDPRRLAEPGEDPLSILRSWRDRLLATEVFIAPPGTPIDDAFAWRPLGHTDGSGHVWFDEASTFGAARRREDAARYAEIARGAFRRHYPVVPVAEVQQSLCADHATTEPTDPMERALWLRRNRHTGPAQQQRVPRRIDPRRNR